MFKPRPGLCPERVVTDPADQADLSGRRPGSRHRLIRSLPSRGLEKLPAQDSFPRGRESSSTDHQIHVDRAENQGCDGHADHRKSLQWSRTATTVHVNSGIPIGAEKIRQILTSGTPIIIDKPLSGVSSTNLERA
jgi:hypothetical protein